MGHTSQREEAKEQIDFSTRPSSDTVTRVAIIKHRADLVCPQAASIKARVERPGSVLGSVSSQFCAAVHLWDLGFCLFRDITFPQLKKRHRQFNCVHTLASTRRSCSGNTTAGHPQRLSDIGFPLTLLCRRLELQILPPVSGGSLFCQSKYVICRFLNLHPLKSRPITSSQEQSNFHPPPACCRFFFLLHHLSKSSVLLTLPSPKFFPAASLHSSPLPAPQLQRSGSRKRRAAGQRSQMLT